MIFGVDDTSSSDTDNRKNNFLVLGEGPAENIYERVYTAEKKLKQTLLNQVKHSLWVYLKVVCK